MRQAAPGEALGEAGVVEVALSAQSRSRAASTSSLVVAPRDEGPPQLRHRVVPPGEPSERPLVGAWGAAPPERCAACARYCSRSKDCIVRSISSAAMSEVDWMPWILSLNSSGLLARRSASS